MNVFGSSRSSTNDIYVKLGLKKRTNAEVRDVFLKEIKSMTDEWGLEIPKYDESAQPA